MWLDCSHPWNDNETCVLPGSRPRSPLARPQPGELRGILPALNLRSTQCAELDRQDCFRNYFEDSPEEQYLHTRLLARDHSNPAAFLTIRGEVCCVKCNRWWQPLKGFI